jgi:hypothetical protein
MTMGRFERDDIDAGRLPASLGTATEDLGSTVESEVARIVERAELRAVEIEDRARQKASRVEQSSERRARELLQDSRERSSQMLAGIDAIERGVEEAVRSLRAETKRLTDDIESAKTEPFLPPEATPTGPLAESEPEAPPEEAAVESPAAPPAREPEPELEVPAAGTRPPDVREIIRRQLLTMAEGGRTRADAERMLLRFREGEQYFDLLDDIYPAESAGRRGLLRRRKEPESP